MKKYYYSLFAAATMLLATTSCSQDEEIIQQSGEMTTFKVELDGASKSRTAGDGQTVNTLYYAVYNYKDDVEKEVIYPKDKKFLTTEVKDGKATVSLPLMKSEQYDIVFWAQNDEAQAYTFTELNNITVNYTGMSSNMESRDAFFNALNDYTADGNTKTIELRRPFAQLNVATSKADWEEATRLYQANGGTGDPVKSSAVTISNLATTFNALTGGASVATTEKVTFNKANLLKENDAVESIKIKKTASDGTKTEEEYKLLAMNYLLMVGTKAPQDVNDHVAADGDIAKANVEVNFTLWKDDATEIVTAKVPAAPIQRNYRTNILGNFLTGDATQFNIVVDAEFDKEDHDVEAGIVFDEKNKIARIYSGEGLKDFAAYVNGTKSRAESGDIFEGWTVYLEADIDLNGEEWTPIGDNTNYFTGTFDGKSKTIRNFKVTTKEGYAGLFGYARANFKNLTVEYVTIKANHYAGGIVGQGYCNFDNCHAKNVNITLTTKNNDWGDKAGGIIGQNCEGAKYIKNCNAENVTIKGYRDLGGIAGMAHNNNIVSDCSVKNVTIIPDLSVHYEKEIPTTYGGVVGRKGSDVTFENNDEEVEVAYAAAAVYADGTVKTYDSLADALGDEKAIKISMFEDAQLADNYRLVVETDKKLTIVLGGYTLSANNTETKTHNFFIDVKGGTLNLSNGTVEYTHTGTNMGWNGATTIIDVTAGGVLNLDGVKVINKGGTDMNFAVHMNNWGEATVVANNSSFEAPYCGFRVFNSGPDKNNVTISNSTFTGNNRAFWVHNYDSADFGGKLYSSSKDNYDVEKVKDRLNFDIIGKNNTFTLASETAISPIRYGFSKSTYINPETGEELNVVNTENLPTVEVGGEEKKNTIFEEDVVLGGDLTLSAGETSANSGYGATGVSVVEGAILDGNGKTLTVNDANTTWDCVVYAVEGTIKNLTVKGAMRGIFMGKATGDVYIDNVIFDDVIYTFNSDGGDKNYGVYISNCTINGWTSHSNVHKEVVYTNCKFGKGSGYAFCRPYGKTVYKNCEFSTDMQFDTSNTSDITFENCTYGGVKITAENAETLKTGDKTFFYNGVNGVTIK